MHKGTKVSLINVAIIVAASILSQALSAGFQMDPGWSTAMGFIIGSMSGSITTLNQHRARDASHS